MNNKEKISRERQFIVVKANKMIQDARFDFSLQEQKVIAYLISKIKPDDSEMAEQEFNIKEFCQICGIDDNNGKNYADLKKTIQSLADKSIWIKIESEKKETLFRWIDKASIVEQSGIITLKLSDDIKPFLLQLREKFTQYGLIYTLPMRSQYSIRIYEILKSYENMHKKNFIVDELKKRLMCENKSYENFSNFRKYVVDIAISEINEFTDIFVDYTNSKTGRKVTHIEFSITSKRDSAEKIRTLNKIEALLNSPNERIGV